ncbi:conjugal transfer protein TraA, partial [Sinorhizobium meliloti]
EAGEFSADRKERMQTGLNQALERAAQMAIEGNSYIRQVAEQDPGLQRPIEREENKPDRPEEVKAKAPSNAEAVDEQQRGLRAEKEDRQPIDGDARAPHELAPTVAATNRLQDRLSKDKEGAQRSGETTRTDPAQQHVPRLEELEREQMQQRERDRDDRDR